MVRISNELPQILLKMHQSFFLNNTVYTKKKSFSSYNNARYGTASAVIRSYNQLGLNLLFRINIVLQIDDNK